MEANDDTARKIERAENAYRNVKRGAGIGALLVGGIYAFAVAVAMADGDQQGFDLPVEIAAGWVGGWLILAMLSSGAWLLEKGNYVSMHQVVGPVIRDAVRAEMTVQTPVVARGVAQVVNSGLDLKLRTAANRAGDRTVAALRESLTVDMTDIVEAGLKRSQRYGMTMQAVAQGRNGGYTSAANVVPIREMSPGD